MKKIAVLICAVILISAAAPMFARALDTGNSQAISLPNPLGEDCNNAECLLVKVLDALWVLASLLTTFMILVGGFQMLTAAGNPAKIETARKTITYAVIGFGIVILSYSASAIIKSVFETASSSSGTSTSP